MMTDNENGKKHLEREALYSFIEAYEYSQGEELVPASASEAPDFICQRPDGSSIGIELTKIMRDPRTGFYESVLDHKDHMTGNEALDKILEALDRKMGLASNKTLLVLQSVDCPLSALISSLESIKGDFDSYNFEEIWVADYTGIEACGDIDLFCLHPLENWGYYQRSLPDRKPYG